MSGEEARALVRLMRLAKCWSSSCAGTSCASMIVFKENPTHLSPKDAEFGLLATRGALLCVRARALAVLLGERLGRIQDERHSGACVSCMEQ